MIPLILGGDDPGFFERCCFGRSETPHWTSVASRSGSEQVACCSVCANIYRIKDVPSKRYWCEKERQIAKAMGGALSQGKYQRPKRVLKGGY